MLLRAGDVVIWDPKPELAWRLIAIARKAGIAPEAIPDWRAEARANAETIARTTAQTTGGRILVWNADRTLKLLEDFRVMGLPS